jgi:hydroxymethylpyrimidine/phosphomethylpyrimidine kinase
MQTPRALTIAGSDSGGGAGIQADLKTFAVHGVFGTSAVTAVTAQNTRGVLEVVALPAAFVGAQIDAVLDDIGTDVVKIGMLANAEITALVARRLADLRATPIVLDPVMVAKGGARLVGNEAVELMRTALLPIATIVTANVPEAEALTGCEIRTTRDLERAGVALVALGARAALVKGGHLPGRAVDVLAWPGGSLALDAERINTRHTHGTGCTLAAAIASQLALGAALPDAVTRAKRYVTWAIRNAPGLGSGHGPLGWGRGGLE